jgi:hypothetical protein
MRDGCGRPFCHPHRGAPSGSSRQSRPCRVYPFPAQLIPAVAARLDWCAWTPPQTPTPPSIDGTGPHSACCGPRSDFGPPCRSRNAARTQHHPGGSAGSRLIPHSHFRVPRSAEPGAVHWHDPVRDAARYRTLAALSYRYVLTLTDSEIEHTPDLACRRIRAFLADPTPAVALSASR